MEGAFAKDGGERASYRIAPAPPDAIARCMPEPLRRVGRRREEDHVADGARAGEELDEPIESDRVSCGVPEPAELREEALVDVGARRVARGGAAPTLGLEAPPLLGRIRQLAEAVAQLEPPDERLETLRRFGRAGERAGV